MQISTYNIPVGHKVYSLCNGNLFSYNTEDTEVYVFDRLNGLHDTKIQFIRYSNASQKLILVYENGNIDLIYPDDFDGLVNHFGFHLVQSHVGITNNNFAVITFADV